LNTTKRGKKKPAPKQEKPSQFNLFAQNQNPSNRSNSPISPQNTPLPDPRPYSGVLQEHYKQGSLVAE
jgi:hypothetical protein